MLELLVTTFNDLRHGRTEEGTVVEKPSTVMSTAEAVAVSHSAALDAAYFGNGRLESGHVARQLLGTVLKDNPGRSEEIEALLRCGGESPRQRQQDMAAVLRSKEVAAQVSERSCAPGLAGDPDHGARWSIFPSATTAPPARAIWSGLFGTRKPNAILIEGPASFTS